MYKRLFVLLVMGSLFLACAKEKKFEGSEYFPLEIGNAWQYSGMTGLGEVTEEKLEDHTQVFIITYYDTTGGVNWTEEYVVIEDQVSWKSFKPVTFDMPALSFYPPLPMSPLSDKVGDTKSVEIIEKRADSVGTQLLVKVDYLVEGIEEVTVPAGTFKDCIRMKTNYTYQDSTQFKFMEGEGWFWYAKGVGTVKLKLPHEEVVLLEAKVGGRTFP